MTQDNPDLGLKNGQNNMALKIKPSSSTWTLSRSYTVKNVIVVLNLWEILFWIWISVREVVFFLVNANVYVNIKRYYVGSTF